MIFGTFDLLHPGHVFVLEEAGKRGDVTVIVARAKNVESIKGKVPRDSEEKRLEAIRSRFPAYDVQLGDASDFLKPVRDLKPDIILLGYDQQLPPGVTPEDLPCPVERLPGHQPERFKSSLIQ